MSHDQLGGQSTLSAEPAKREGANRDTVPKREEAARIFDENSLRAKCTTTFLEGVNGIS